MFPLKGSSPIWPSRRRVCIDCAPRVSSTDWGDFEDACVYYAARKIKADAIITRNRKGFAWSSIKVFDCDELFAYLEREVGVSYAGVP